MPNGMDYSLLQRVIDGTGMILDTEPGTPNDVGTYVTESQLADWIKGKILFTGYYYNGNFYSDSGHTTLLAKVNGALYIDQTNANKALYACLSSTYQSLTEEAQVQAIIDGLNDGTIVPLKAKQDQNGNVIDQTYETKADASDLKSAIDNNSQRIENLEVAVSGSLVQTNTDATMANTKTITNANSILPWAILKRAGARAVSWNQFISNGNFADGTGWQTGNASISVADNVATVTASAQYGGIIQYSTRLIAGHKYLMLADVKPATNTQTIAMYCYKGSGYNAVNYHGGTGWYTLSNIFTLNGTSATTTIMVQETTSEFVAFNVRNVMIFDLTQMAFESITVNEFRSLLPASYYPQDTGHIISLNPSAFKVVGKNKADVSKVGHCPVDSSGATRVGIPMYLQAGTYIVSYSSNPNSMYLTVTTELGGVYTNTSLPSNNTFTISNPCNVYVRIGNDNIGDWRFTDFQVELGSTATAYEAYTETTIDTSFTEDYLYVNESCHDYSENVLVNGVMRRKEHLIVGSYTFTGNETWEQYTAWDSSTTWRIALANLPDVLKQAVDGWGGEQFFALYESGTVGEVLGGTKDKSIILNGTSGLYICDSSITSTSDCQSKTSGRTIYFKLASPSTPTLHDPIPNIPCEDGTTVQAVTPQTDLVNAIDVPSTIAYMTKISS